MSDLFSKLYLLITLPCATHSCAFGCLPDKNGEFTDVTSEEDSARTKSYGNDTASQMKLSDLVDEHASRKLEFQSTKQPNSMEPLACLSAGKAVRDAGGDACVRSIRMKNNSVVITAAMMTQLRHDRWLSEDIVNFCFMVMAVREAKNGGRRKTHFVTSSLFAMLFGDVGEYDFERVQTWSTKERLGYTMTSCDKIIVALNETNTHWTIMVIDLDKEVMTLYDSLCRNVKKPFTTVMLQQFDNLERWVYDCLENELVESAVLDGERRPRTFHKGKFPFHRRVAEVVRQENNADCGVFAIMFAWCLVANIDPHERPGVLGGETPLTYKYQPSRNVICVDRFRKMIARDILNHGTTPDTGDGEIRGYTDDELNTIHQGQGTINLISFARAELAAAEEKADALHLEASRLSEPLPGMRSKMTDAMIDAFLVEPDDHMIEHKMTLADSPHVGIDLRRVYFTARIRGLHPALRKLALATYIKQTYEASPKTATFYTVASDAFDSFRLVRLIYDFMPSELMNGVWRDHGPIPPWANIILRRLSPHGLPFQAREAEDMRRALRHLQCPYEDIFQLFSAAQHEASVDDDGVVDLSGYESSVPEETDTDEENDKLEPDYERTHLESRSTVNTKRRKIGSDTAIELEHEADPGFETKLDNPVIEIGLGPEPEPEPVVEAEAEAEPEPEIEIEPEPVLEIEPEPEPVIEIEIEPVVEIEPEPVVEPDGDAVSDDLANMVTEMIAAVVAEDLHRTDSVTETAGAVESTGTAEETDATGTVGQTDATEATKAVGEADRVDSAVTGELSVSPSEWIAEQHAREDREADKWLAEK